MFSDRDRYVFNLLLHLATRDADHFITIRQTARTLEVPEAYLSKVAGELGEMGYLETKKGPDGGIRLREDPDEILLTRLLEDLGTLEHNPHGDACCVPKYFERCIVRRLTDDFKSKVLGETTLGDMLKDLQPDPPAEA